MKEMKTGWSAVARTNFGEKGSFFFWDRLSGKCIEISHNLQGQECASGLFLFLLLLLLLLVSLLLLG